MREHPQSTLCSPCPEGLHYEPHKWLLLSAPALLAADSHSFLTPYPLKTQDKQRKQLTKMLVCTN